MRERQKALVIGYGSIGRRHTRILSELGLNCAVVTSQSVGSVTVFPEIHSAIETFHPEYVVIASPTARHSDDLLMTRDSGFTGPVLVEKPVTDHPARIPAANESQVFVGYNLRFLAVISALKKLIGGHRVLSVGFWNGQYLPEWRPDRRYQETSSASRSLGGGVLRDLSHDLDLAAYLFGDVVNLVATMTFSDSLEIDTEDTVHVCAESEMCSSLVFHFSYLDRIPRHEIFVTTDRTTVICDLLTGAITSPGLHELWPTARDQTFKLMHESVINDDVSVVCSLAEASHVVMVINAIERSAREGRKIRL